MKKLFITTLAMIIFALVLSSCMTKQTTVNGIKIEFPYVAEEATDFSNIEFQYNVDDLKRQIDEYLSKHEVFIFTNPKQVDYELLAEKFGFEKDKYIENDEGKRMYYVEKPDIWATNIGLEIEPSGCFTYTSGKQGSSNIEFKFTEKECMQIASDFLKEKGLFPLNISQNWSTNEEGNMELVDGKEEKTVTLIGINFFRGEIEEAEVYGTSRISVDINGDGEIVKVYYNYIDYGKKEKTELISIKKALKNLKNGECYSFVDFQPQKVEIKSVVMMYYAQERFGNDSHIQPVYCFVGEAIGASGEKTNNAVFMIQANKV